MRKEYEIKFPKEYFDDLRKNKKQRIYDGFIFYNEINLLKLRLEELSKVVDYFIVAESDKTFSGKDKPFYFEENKQGFEKWKNKIIHIKVYMPHLNSLDNLFIFLEKRLPRKPQLFLRKVLANVIGGVSRYKMGEFNRRKIIEGLRYASEEDIIMGVDLDEIPNVNKFKEMKILLEKFKFVEFEQRNFRYYLNGMVVGEESLSAGTRACKLKSLKNDLKGKIDYLRTTPYQWRKFNRKKYGKHNYSLIKNGGWHFSSWGGTKSVIDKFSNTTHPEFDKKNLYTPELIEKIVETGQIILSNSKVEYVKIDKTFPSTLRKNQEEYKAYIKSQPKL